MKPQFKPGDIVRYTGKFLKSSGMLTGAPLNGIIKDLGAFGDKPIAYVRWCSLDDNDDPIGVLLEHIEIDQRATALQSSKALK